MKIEKNKYYAVLTGDIIKSSSLHYSTRRKLYNTIKSISDLLRIKYKQIIPYDIDIFRGDSWQLLITDPVFSLRIALLIRVLLKILMENIMIDSRIAIGIGTIDFISEQNLSSSDGDAFRSSGLSLENNPKQFNLTFSISQPRYRIYSDLFDIIIKLTDFHVNKSTLQQTRALYGALSKLTQMQTVKNVFQNSITQQAVADHLNKAGWLYIKYALNFFEKQVNELLMGI